jgi:hypothetical protein
MLKRLAELILNRLLATVVAARPDADQVINTTLDGKRSPYINRWFVIPHNRWFNIYLHQTLRDDWSRDLHDHPWDNMSFILKGGYFEEVPLVEVQDDVDLSHVHGNTYLLRRRPGDLVFRFAERRHRLTLPPAMEPDGSYTGELQPAWSLFITGPKRREWGFHAPDGWIHWKDYVDDPARRNVPH